MLLCKLKKVPRLFKKLSEVSLQIHSCTDVYCTAVLTTRRSKMTSQWRSQVLLKNTAVEAEAAPANFEKVLQGSAISTISSTTSANFVFLDQRRTFE